MIASNKLIIPMAVVYLNTYINTSGMPRNLPHKLTGGQLGSVTS